MSFNTNSKTRSAQIFQITSYWSFWALFPIAFGLIHRTTLCALSDRKWHTNVPLMCVERCALCALDALPGPLRKCLSCSSRVLWTNHLILVDAGRVLLQQTAASQSMITTIPTSIHSHSSLAWKAVEATETRQGLVFVQGSPQNAEQNKHAANKRHSTLIVLSKTYYI